MDILINLLPPERREEIKNLRYTGIILKIGVMAVFALVVLACFSYACFYFISVEERSIDEETALFEQTASYKEALKNQNSLREYDKIASKVKSGFEKQEKYWGVISEINSITPKGIVFSMFALSEEGELSLKGIAYTRTDMLDFKKGLEQSSLFEKVESPISNFVVETDINFEFTAKIKK